MSTTKGTKASSTSSALGSLGSIVFSLRFAYYVLGVLACVVLAIKVCSYPIYLVSASARAELEIFLVGLLVIWLALALAVEAKSINHLPLFASAVALVATPTAGLFLRFTDTSYLLFFGLTVVAWVLFGIIFLLREVSGEGFSLESFSAAVGVAWAISGAIIALGTIPILPYASSAISKLSSVSLVLDLRYSLGLIFTASILIAAMIRAFRTKPPMLPALTTWKIAESAASGIIASAILPFISLINVFLLVGCLITEYLLKAVRLVVFYFVETGSNIVEIIRRIFLEKPVIQVSIKVISTFILAVISLVAASSSVAFLVRYLQSGNWWPELASLWPIILIYALILLCVGGITWIFLKDTECAVVALATLLSIVFVAGLLLYGLARVDFLELVGFNYPGPFFVTMLALIVGGVAKTLLPSSVRQKRIITKKVPQG